MNENFTDRIMVIRPRPGLGSGQIDFLHLNADGSEQLVYSHVFPKGDPWFKDLGPLIQSVSEAEVTVAALDFDGVYSLDSTSLMDLVRLSQTIEADGGKLVLVNLHPRVKGILEVTQLDRLFQIFASLESGVAFLGSMDPVTGGKNDSK
jgi:anti-anti-sigma factor